MKRNLSILTLVLTLAIVPLLLLCGCNIFGWMTEEDTGLGHLAKGQQLLRDGEYQEAVAELGLAIEEDPYNSEARYYHSKALVLAAGIDVMWLADQVDQPESVRDTVPLPIFSVEGTDTAADIAAKNTIYRANLGVREDLTWIIDGRATGKFKPDDIVVDLAVATTLCAILGLRDTDQDGDVDEEDIILEIIPYEEIYEILRLYEFLTGGLYKPGDGPPNPERINVLIDFVLNLIEEARPLVHHIIERIKPELNFEEIENLIDDIEATVQMYYYDDGLDNDSDGQIDEETLDGIDNDGDGRTDEDTDHI
ncbi:MAG: hypothetical protein ACE5JC_10390 [Candidatus Zixiibacteriota bacterium]